MTLKNLFIANSAIAVFGALALLLLPTALLDTFGMRDDPGSKLWMQFFGSQWLASGLITLFALNTDELRSQRSLTLSFFIAYGIGLIVAIGGVLSDALNSTGWVLVILLLALTLGFGYFQFIGPSD